MPGLLTAYYEVLETLYQKTTFVDYISCRSLISSTTVWIYIVPYEYTNTIIIYQRNVVKGVSRLVLYAP